MGKSLYFKYGEKEINWLKSRDPVLGKAIDEIGHIDRFVIPDLFMAMINAIVGQQISSKAQITVWGRMLERFIPFTAATINSVPAEELQVCGISMRKAVCIKEIAKLITEGSLDLTQLYDLNDEDVCKKLIQIKGIGTWTAEMLMIFSMQRPDILSWNDLAIQRGMRILYRHREITTKLFNKYKRRYSPYASTASLYLWAISSRENT